MTNALERQVGGTHYKGMKIQPLEFAMANAWDAGAFSILKYLSRHATKNGLQDVEKALHFIDLRDHFYEHVTAGDTKIAMSDYIVQNAFAGPTATALYHLYLWVKTPAGDHHLVELRKVIAVLERQYRDQG